MPRRCSANPGTSRRLRLLAVAVGAAATLGVAGCSEDKGGGGDDDAGVTTAPDAVVPEVAVGGTCNSSDDCPGQFCDKRHKGCVDCYLERHCPDGQTCRYGQCVDLDPCGDVQPCDFGVCGATGSCSDCEADSDCVEGLVCVANVCRPPYPECDEYADCEAQAAICDAASGRCASCDDPSQCGDQEQCEGGECVPRPCIPSSASCVGPAVMVCRADGQGYSLSLCDEGQTCYSGECVFDECEPGTAVCDRFQLKQCTFDGKLLVKSCPPGQECHDNECRTMKHRVLVVFDTSNSMNWYPGQQVGPNLCGAGAVEGCLQPWPVCEDLDEPVTTLGISKSVFRQFFESDVDNVLFGLQRFPQVAADPSPVCEGGYYLWQNEITGDDGATSLPIDQLTWFDLGLSEVLLVGFPPTGAEGNVAELAEWMDGLEFTVDTEEPCDTPRDCPKGVCLGPTGKKTCRAFANPEMRAQGMTPLGKSLFYASEFMRRYVVVDGKPCSTDADCGSPSYWCSRGGKCFDPLRECRLNIIVLFTDGGETEHPFTDSFFNPIVQAKRMRLGMGCASDEECSQLDCCTGDGACYPNYCHPTGYCTNDLIEADEVSPVMLGVPPDAKRLTDYNGNGIDIIVNVVDASIMDPQGSSTVLNNNRLIALNGCGSHIVVDVDDPPNFLEQLKITIDFKTFFGQCSATPVEPD